MTVRHEHTRLVTVTHIFDMSLRQGGTRWEAFCKPLDGAWPNSIVGSTFDVFTADMLRQACLSSDPINVTTAPSEYGQDILRAEWLPGREVA